MSKRPFLDPDHPMFARAWVRWVVSLAPILWGLGEFWTGSPMWGMIFVALGAYAFKTLVYDRT